MTNKGGMTLDKQILSDYIDACELVKETEKDIFRLERKKKSIIQTNVKGSMSEFPYTEQHFKIQGTAFSVKDDDSLRYEKGLLEQRKANAAHVKVQVEEWMLTIPARMQRIVRMKYFEGKTWEEVADRINKNMSGETIRKEFERFLKK